MGLLVWVAVAVIVVWLLVRGSQARRDAQEVRDLPQADLLIEALYRDGVRLGYKHAWAHQAEAERQRVAAFVRRRERVVVSVLVGGCTLVGAALMGAVGVLPGQSEWAPVVRTWHWLGLAAACAGLGVWLVKALVPRDYARYSAAPESVATHMAAASQELEEVAKVHAERQAELARSYLTKLIDDRFTAGLEQGRRDAARLFNGADVQTRVSSAANAAYVQGRADGANEAQKLAAEAYGRGLAEGQRTALAGAEERIRVERQASYQAGLRAGRTESQGQRQPSGGQARPRTVAEALLVLEIQEGASRVQIEQRYRELRAAVHPDAMRSKKMPRAMVKLAEEQFKLIGEAYDIILKG